jgi:hypothetical protein
MGIIFTAPIKVSLVGVGVQLEVPASRNISLVGVDVQLEFAAIWDNSMSTILIMVIGDVGTAELVLMRVGLWKPV